MTKITTDITIPEEWTDKFDKTIASCSSALATGINTIKNSIIVMNGIKTLKEFFSLPPVKELIEMSKDNRAGFLTDRSPAAVLKHNKNPKKKYELKPYTYEQIINALLPCMLEGYRPHGNEINIISGIGMPVKKGKHRRIIEMTDGYQDNISTPAIKDGYAFMKCKAKWKINGQIQTIGYEEKDEIHIKIPFGQWDSLDKVIGLAESKLWTRVLRRITGAFIMDEPSEIDITEEAYMIDKKADIPSPEINSLKPDLSVLEKDEQKKTEDQFDSAVNNNQLPDAAAEGIEPVFTELQEIYENPENSVVIQKLITKEILPMSLGSHIEDTVEKGDVKEARDIIRLIEKNK